MYLRVSHHRHTTSPSPAPHGRAAPVPEEAARWQSPAVLELAEQHGLKPSELQQIPGTGRDGRVTKKDLLAYLEQRETVAVPGAREEIIPFTPMRRAIAEHMVRSKHTSPHATAIIEVDMTAIAQFREREKAAFAEAWRKHNMGSYERFQWLKSHLEAVEGCEPHHARVPFRPVLCRAWWTPQHQGTCGRISHDA